MRGRMPQSRLLRLLATCLGLALCLGLTGCSLFRSKTEKEKKDAELKELLKAPEPPNLIREATVVQGMQPVEVTGVGAVTKLAGTGGPADPSVFRDQLLEEMKTHDIPNPNGFLEDADKAMVRVRATIPAGARRGDTIDIRVLAPKESRATDLRGGWLLDTRLRQQQVIQNVIKQSDVMSVGTGTLLTRANFTPGTDAALRLEGNILGGGRVQVDRNVGLILRPKYQHAKMAAAIAEAINRRFFFFDGTTRRGIAKPVSDEFIEIEVHPRYRNNIPRMMEVVRAIAANPNTSDSQARLAELAKLSSVPATAADAALQLEGIGENAVPTLLEAIKSTNPELRFYAAEALAYLDRNEAIEPMEEAVRSEAAFRHSAIMALQGLQKPLALDALNRLMDVPSLETRYGAFCAIRRRIDGQQMLNGRSLKSFMLYEVPSTAAPVIVVSLRESPEIVVFGNPSAINIPKFMMGETGWILKPESEDPAKIRVSRFRPGQEDQRASTGNRIADVIQGIAATGGVYGDVVELLRQAKAESYLTDQLAIDPLPRSLRTYYRDQDGEESDDAKEADLIVAGTAK
jgi:Flagellar P-ring protein/HEAT repeats